MIIKLMASSFFFTAIQAPSIVSNNHRSSISTEYDLQYLKEEHRADPVLPFQDNDSDTTRPHKHHSVLKSGALTRVGNETTLLSQKNNAC